MKNYKRGQGEWTLIQGRIYELHTLSNNKAILEREAKNLRKYGTSARIRKNPMSDRYRYSLWYSLKSWN